MSEEAVALPRVRPKDTRKGRRMAPRILREYRHVVREPVGEDGGAMRQMLRGLLVKDPKGFMDRWERHERDWLAHRTTAAAKREAAVVGDGGIDLVREWLRERSGLVEVKPDHVA